MNNADFSAAETLVLGDPLVLEPSRLTDRLLARALGASLDQQLAAGWLAGIDPAAGRARPGHRRAPPPRLPGRQAGTTCCGSPAGPRHAAPGRYRCAPPRSSPPSPAIHELMERLTAPLPVGAQGVATAGVLLTDPTSPVYSRRGPDSLADLLQAAITKLDPARPLMQGA